MILQPTFSHTSIWKAQMVEILEFWEGHIPFLLCLSSSTWHPTWWRNIDLTEATGWFFWTTPVDLHIRWEVWAETSRPYPVCYHQGEGTVLRRGALASLREQRNGVQKKIRADTSCQLLAIISRKKSWWVCELLLSDDCWVRVVRIQKNNSTSHRWLCLHYF